MQTGQTQVLILAGIVLVLAVAGGIFFLGRLTTPKPSPSPTPEVIQTPQPSPKPISTPSTTYQAPKPTPLPTTTPDPTANWKTYTNTNLGYSLKYPPELTGSLGDYNFYRIIPLLSERSGLDYVSSGIDIYEIDKKYNPNDLSLEEYAKTKYIQGKDVERSVEKISLNGSEGLKIIHSLNSEIYISIYVKYNSKNYAINFSQICSDPKVCISIDTFNQILSTFRFLP